MNPKEDHHYCSLQQLNRSISDLSSLSSDFFKAMPMTSYSSQPDGEGEPLSLVRDRRAMRERLPIENHEQLIPYLTENRHMTCVHAAAHLGCLDCLKWMVEHIGMQPNEQDVRYGATPLHYASSGGHVKLVRFLLSRIDTVHPDFDGATPLHDAAVMGHLTCVQDLLRSTLVDPDVTDNYGLTAAEWADQAQHSKCAKVIRDCAKRNASHAKRKRSILKSNKTKSDGLPAFSQYSGSISGSHSSSPSSDTYAQLEPVDCVCSSPPSLPPRPPNTPRPSRQVSRDSTSRSHSTPDRARSHSCDEDMLPSPAHIPAPILLEEADEVYEVYTDNLPLRSAGQNEELPPPPSPLLESIDHPCYFTPRQFSNNEAPTNGHITSRIQNQSTKQSDISYPALITLGGPGFHKTSTTCQPGAPLQTFSTFGACTGASGSVASQVHNSVQQGHAYEEMTPGHIPNYHSNMNGSPVHHLSQMVNEINFNNSNSPQFMNQCGSTTDTHVYTNQLSSPSHNLPRLHLNNIASSPQHQPFVRPPDKHHHAPIHHQTSAPTIPAQVQRSQVRRCQTLRSNSHNERREKAEVGQHIWFSDPQLEDSQLSRWIVVSSGGLLKVAEVPAIPEWMKSLNERKVHTGIKSKSFDEAMSPVSEIKLAPWQREVKQSGRVVPFD